MKVKVSVIAARNIHFIPPLCARPKNEALLLSGHFYKQKTLRLVYTHTYLHLSKMAVAHFLCPFGALPTKILGAV